MSTRRTHGYLIPHKPRVSWTERLAVAVVVLGLLASLMVMLALVCTLLFLAVQVGGLILEILKGLLPHA